MPQQRITIAHLYEHLITIEEKVSTNNQLLIKILNENKNFRSILTHNKKQLKQMATSFNDEMDLLLAEVSKENTDIASMKAFIDNLKGQVVVQLDLTPEQQAKADELFSNISSNDQEILDAINTTPAP